MVKREARRKMVTLPPAKVAELKRVRQRILVDEKAELSALARKVRQQYEAATIELTHAAELLKREREGQGLSLADMQKRSGLGRAALCRLENLVDPNPTIGTLDRIAKALGKRLVIALEDRT